MSKAGLLAVLVLMAKAYAMPPAAPPADAPKPAAIAAPRRAVVEYRLTLPSARGDPQRVNELSALAWNPVDDVLLAVSDRGVLFRYRLQWQAGALQARLLDRSALPPGVGDNAEALAWRATSAQAGELLLAPELGRHAWRLTAAGRPLAPLAWPASLAALRAQDARHGVEAAAWHAQHGLLAALQRPHRKPSANTPGAEADGPRLHTIHAGQTLWRFAPAGPDSHLKAIEVLGDGSLLLLERTRALGGGGLQTHLRWLDPAQCGEARPCAAPAIAFEPPLPAGEDNDEGLACTAAGWCWIVNDSGPGRAGRTRLIQFRLHAR